jgi:hypothetical protein
LGPAVLRGPAAAGREGGVMQVWLYALYALSLAVAAGLMYWSFAA